MLLVLSIRHIVGSFSVRDWSKNLQSNCTNQPEFYLSTDDYVVSLFHIHFSILHLIVSACFKKFLAFLLVKSPISRLTVGLLNTIPQRVQCFSSTLRTRRYSWGGRFLFFLDGESFHIIKAFASGAEGFISVTRSVQSDGLSPKMHIWLHRYQW